MINSTNDFFFLTQDFITTIETTGAYRVKTNGQLEDTGQSRNWGKVILDCEKQSISTL